MLFGSKIAHLELTAIKGNKRRMAKTQWQNLFTKFAYMRIITAAIMLLVGVNCNAQKNVSNSDSGQTQKMTKEEALTELQKLPGYSNYPQGPPASADTIQIRQPDETKIHIIGFGGMFIHYTETIDGYTLYLNDQGVYEYAVRGDKGDLKGSGVDARDPEERSAAEKLAVASIPKHLRFEDDKLKYLIIKQYKWNESVYYGKQYREYKKQQKKESQEQNEQKKK
jgi:hypothetical protein